jgi:4-amino-4-deoxy-L-arabinose transferase-like glycosyltransferase
MMRAVAFAPLRQHICSARTTAVIVAIVVLITAALRLPLLNIPFERDEGEYAYIAWRMDYGELPYRDWVDQKPPGIFLVYRLALALPLPAIAAVHFVALLWSAASACALFFLARRFLNAIDAAAAAVLFAILLADPMIDGASANTELFMLLPLILSQIAFVHSMSMERPNFLLITLIGALVGIAAAFKQVGIVNWPLLLFMYPIFATHRKKNVFWFAWWSGLGVTIVWAAIAAYFHFRNSLNDFVYHVFRHNLHYLSAEPWLARWRFFRRAMSILWPSLLFIWMAAALSFVLPRPVGGWKWLWFVLGWLLTSVVAVSLSGYFFPHYFQQLLPPLALMAVMGAGRLCQARWLLWAPLIFRRLVFALLLGILPATVFYPFLFKYSWRQAIDIIYPDNFFDLMPSVATRLAQKTRPDDKVYVFGSEPELLFYAKRLSATRYIILFPLYGAYSDALEKQKATIEEISRARPAAALVATTGLIFPLGSNHYFTRWTQEYLDHNYQPDTYITLDSSFKVHSLSSDNLPPLIPADQQPIITLMLRDLR